MEKWRVHFLCPCLFGLLFWFRQLLFCILYFTSSWLLPFQFTTFFFFYIRKISIFYWQHLFPYPTLFQPPSPQNWAVSHYLAMNNEQKRTLWSPLPHLRWVDGRHTQNPSDSDHRLANSQVTEWSGFEKEVLQKMKQLGTPPNNLTPYQPRNISWSGMKPVCKDGSLSTSPSL